VNDYEKQVIEMMKNFPQELKGEVLDFVGDLSQNSQKNQLLS